MSLNERLPSDDNENIEDMEITREKIAVDLGLPEGTTWFDIKQKIDELANKSPDRQNKNLKKQYGSLN